MFDSKKKAEALRLKAEHRRAYREYRKYHPDYCPNEVYNQLQDAEKNLKWWQSRHPDYYQRIC